MSETFTKNLTDKATYERLEKDVSAVKNDIAALTDQITDALNSFAGTATKQARRGYKQARANAEAAVDDMSERGGAMLDAAQDAAASIEETLEEVITQRPLATVGLALGIGFLIALAATAWPRWGGGSLTLVAALNAVPIVALAPIMNLWFGDGIGSRIAIVTATTMAAMAINAYKGMAAIDPLALDLMHSYAASKPAVFRYLRIQNSLPYVFTALKINATASMIGAIVGEFFFSSRGLGYLLSNSIKVAKMPLGWSCIVLAAIAGVLFYLIVERLEKVFIKWHSSARS